MDAQIVSNLLLTLMSEGVFFFHISPHKVGTENERAV